IWQEVLGVEEIGVHDKFFELGGYSILLIQMHSRIDQLLPGKVTITDYFAYPTISQLAGFIKRMGMRKNISLTPVHLPSGYFTEGQSVTHNNMFQVMFDHEQVQSMKDIAEELNITIPDILIAVYGYLFAHVSGEKQVEIQVNVEEKDRLMPLCILFDEIDTIRGLFTCTGKMRKKREMAYNPGDMQDFTPVKGKNVVFPVFYERGTLSATFELLDFYDIVFEVHQEHGFGLTCEYNHTLLKEEKIREFIDLYIRLIDIVISKYRQEGRSGNR
ncbi:MAG: hypothetical protein JXB88_23815, partial [Spirochaetales bacterium]|nr:hypothetical protein [Spirochaetales bacterium]